MIIGIDPGTFESAFCTLDPKDLRIINFGKIPNRTMLELIETQRGELSQVFMETFQNLGMGAIGQSVFQTCIWIGEFKHAAKPTPVRLIFRTDVKMHLCRTTKARDPNIRQALIDRFGEPGTKKSPGKLYGISGDVWSALAIALTGLETKAKLEA